VTELTLYCDGGSRGNPGPAAIGAVVYDTTTDPPQLVATVSECIGVTTNNVAEYRALIAGLEKAVELDASEVIVVSDSELLVKQMRGEYRVKNEALRALSAEAGRLARRLGCVEYTHVRRHHNEVADRLVNDALDALGGS